MLVYYCATNMRKLKVLNGKEKGGDVQGLKEIRMVEGSAQSRDECSAILDSKTGDFYLLSKAL